MFHPTNICRLVPPYSLAAFYLLFISARLPQLGYAEDPNLRSCSMFPPLLLPYRTFHRQHPSRTSSVLRPSPSRVPFLYSSAVPLGPLWWTFHLLGCEAPILPHGSFLPVPSSHCSCFSLPCTLFVFHMFVALNFISWVHPVPLALSLLEFACYCCTKSSHARNLLIFCFFLSGEENEPANGGAFVLHALSPPWNRGACPETRLSSCFFVVFFPLTRRKPPENGMGFYRSCSFLCSISMPRVRAVGLSFLTIILKLPSMLLHLCPARRKWKSWILRPPQPFTEEAYEYSQINIIIPVLRHQY